MNTPRVVVSVIIPAHGHAGMTDHCVSSVLTSIGSREDVEIIVVDDASPVPISLDASKDHRVTIIRSDANLRFSRACNFGAQRATGTFLLFLNNDTEVRGNSIVDMIACAETRKDVAVVGAKLAYRDQTVQHAGIAICQGDGLPRHIYRGFPVDHPAVTRDRAFQAVTGACMLVRSDAFDLVRGFDERFANGYEDIDLCLRLHGRGYRTWYCGTTDVVHLESVSLRDSNQHAEALNDPNSALFQARWSNLVSRDEIAIYASDGLISVQSGDVYPLKIVCAPELAELAFQGHDSELARLLGIRSRQVFDLEKDLGYLMARLLDHGVSL